MRNFCIAVLVVVMAGMCFGQAPKASLSAPSTEVFVGYVATFPDYGASFDSYRFNGFEGSFAKGIFPHLYVTATGDYVFDSYKNIRQFTGTVGGKYNLWTGRLRPYIVGEIGYSHQSSHSATGGFYSGDHHPPLAPKVTDIEDGLAYRIGGGADLQMTPKIYWRLLQWDLQPQPWARHTPFYQNWSTGVGWRF